MFCLYKWGNHGSSSMVSYETASVIQSTIHGFLYCFLFSGNLGGISMYIVYLFSDTPISRCLSRCHQRPSGSCIWNRDPTDAGPLQRRAAVGRGPTRWDMGHPLKSRAGNDRRRSVDISRASGLSIVSIGMSRIPGSLGLWTFRVIRCSLLWF